MTLSPEAARIIGAVLEGLYSAGAVIDAVVLNARRGDDRYSVPESAAATAAAPSVDELTERIQATLADSSRIEQTYRDGHRAGYDQAIRDIKTLDAAEQAKIEDEKHAEFRRGYDQAVNEDQNRLERAHRAAYDNAMRDALAKLDEEKAAAFERGYEQAVRDLRIDLEQDGVTSVNLEAWWGFKQAKAKQAKAKG